MGDVRRKSRPDWSDEPEVGSEALYRALFASQEFALFLMRVETEGGFVCEDANPAAARIASRPLGAMLGKSPREALPEGVGQNLENKLRQCADSGKPVTYNMAHEWPKGRVSWTTTLTPVRTASGEIGHILGLTRDITFEKHQQRLAERNEALLERLWAALPQVMYLFNVRTRSVHLIAGQKSKPQGYRAKDFEKLGDEIVPRLVHPDDIPKVEANLEKLARLRDGESSSFEYRFLHHDGTYRHMHSCETVFSRGADGEVELIFGIAEDITDRHLMQEEMRDLSDRLLTLQIDERRRIAQDLHDSTGQHLTAAHLALARIRQGRAEDRARFIGEALDDANRSIDEARKEIRVLSYLLHPPSIGGAGLSEAIRSFAIGFGKRAGLKIETRIQPQGKEVTDEIAVAFFRICQEALANVHRHAHATKVVVTLEVTGSAITLKVADNGLGFDEARLKSGARIGVGIPAMRERMARLGGSVRLYAGKRGTKMVATAPRSAASGGDGA
jgi:two-component system, NarL family, sensor kinase